MPFYRRGRVRYLKFLAATLDLSPGYGRAKVSVRGIKVLMAPAGRRRLWRQETLGYGGRFYCLAEHVSSPMTETAVVCGAPHRILLAQGAFL